MIDLIGLISECILDVQEWLFQKKKKKRRELEKQMDLPKKRMLSPYQRLFILTGGLILLIYVVVFVSKLF